MIRDRYQRQTLVKELGQKGQKLLATKHATVIGGGGLGSHSANLLVRIGIGSVNIIDDDIVDLTNLHRTSVFSEDDIGKSKALILEKKLRSINMNVQVKGINQRVTAKNIWSLTQNSDVILDGTDSITLRLLINRVSIQYNIPWVYAGVYDTIGMVMGILPKKTSCFQCIAQEIPKSKAQQIPVLGSLPAIIAAIQLTETIKILLGRQPSGLLIYDIWNQCFDAINIKRNLYCPTCGIQKKNTIRKK